MLSWYEAYTIWCPTSSQNFILQLCAIQYKESLWSFECSNLVLWAINFLIFGGGEGGTMRQLTIFSYMLTKLTFGIRSSENQMIIIQFITSLVCKRVTLNSFQIKFWPVIFLMKPILLKNTSWRTRPFQFQLPLHIYFGAIDCWPVCLMLCCSIQILKFPKFGYSVGSELLSHGTTCLHLHVDDRSGISYSSWRKLEILLSSPLLSSFPTPPPKNWPF